MISSIQNRAVNPQAGSPNCFASWRVVPACKRHRRKLKTKAEEHSWASSLWPSSVRLSYSRWFRPFPPATRTVMWWSAQGPGDCDAQRLEVSGSKSIPALCSFWFWWLELGQGSVWGLLGVLWARGLGHGFVVKLIQNFALFGWGTLLLMHFHWLYSWE